MPKAAFNVRLGRQISGTRGEDVGPDPDDDDDADGDDDGDDGDDDDDDNEHLIFIYIYIHDVYLYTFICTHIYIITKCPRWLFSLSF